MSMTPGFIVYDSTAYWERDFFFNDIFVSVRDWPVYDMTDYPQPQKDQLTILVFNSNTRTYQTILDIVRELHPRVIVHLSDEWGLNPEFTELVDIPGVVVLRQHNHAHYPKERMQKLHQIPLGYMSGMLKSTIQDTLKAGYKAPSARARRWAFAGNLKQDRVEMLHTFEAMMGEGLVTHSTPPNEMFTVYQDTVFVPCGRGNVKLDCFRLYEACLAGAIPVVVGTEEEMSIDFSFGGIPLPPWVRASTWEEATRKCQLMTDQELSIMQSACVTWISDRVASTRSLIENHLWGIVRTPVERQCDP